MSENDSVSMIETNLAAGRPAHRGDALGAEIPVTVHASRTTQAVGKNLPPVHEDTRTVIVLPQGAVIRLTATLVTGETVVLTNRSTGADVLCRVGNVKSQPGIQHYVDLEFMQRAPGFWGPVAGLENRPASAEPPRNVPPVASSPKSVVTPPLPKSPEKTFQSAPNVVTLPTPPIPAAASIPASTNYETVSVKPTDLSEVTSLTEEIEKAPSVPVQVNPVTVFRPLSTGNAKEPSFASLDAHSSGSSSTQKGLLTAVAAIVLVLMGAAGGYWFYRQQNTQVASVSQAHQVSAPAAPSVSAPQPSAAIAEPTPAAVPRAALPQPQTDIIIDSRPPRELPAAAAPQLSRTSAQTTAHDVKRTVPIGELKSPKVKARLASANSAEPPPMMVASAENVSDAATSALLLGSGSGPAPPAPAKVPIGGQLQSPRLISSTHPVYPQSARTERIQGAVMLDLLVDENGRVVQTQVISGPVALHAAAQESVRNWRYQPAQLNGKPISVHTRVSVNFALQ